VQTTEETSATDSTSTSARRGRRQSRQSTDSALRPSNVEAATNAEAVSQWRLRKREEKKLRERRAFIEATMRRLSQ
jgi:hypothetical protein